MATKNFIEELEWRGMVHTIMPGAKEQLEKEMTTAYLGIDPSNLICVLNGGKAVGDHKKGFTL